MTIQLEIADADRVALVDDEYAYLARYRWRIADKGYVFRHGDEVVRLHQVVMGQRPLPGFVITWKNGNRLDCRRRNLAYIPRGVKQEGTRRRPNRSRAPVGVWFERGRGRWVAALTVNGILRRLGRFDSREAAAAALEAFKGDLHEAR